MRIALIVVALASLLVSCSSSSKTSQTSSTAKKKNPNQELVFEESEKLMPVLELAQKKKKPVFVTFGAVWCAPCRLLKEDVFTQRPTFTYLNKNFINYYVDIDSENGKLLAGIYEVSAIPTVVFLDPQGVVLQRQVGVAQPSDIDRMGKAAIAAMP